MDIWSIYGLCAIALILYSIMGKPKKNTLCNLWLVYIFSGAVIGLFIFN